MTASADLRLILILLRAYMYLIQPLDVNYKLDNSVSHELGYLTLHWKNYLGDPGVLKIGPF
jgi:hypothetical protein